MSAPQPKRLNRQGRLLRQAKMRRAAEHDARTAVRQHNRRSRPRLSQMLEDMLQARAAGRCEMCGHALRGRCQRHHRKLRVQGGLDQAANLVVICGNCHNAVHLNPRWATEHGWIVPSHRNPATVPITLHEGRHVRLTNAGTYEQADA